MAHFILYFVLIYLLIRAFLNFKKAGELTGRQLILLIFFVFFYGLLMEIMQLLIFADRNGDIFDVVANTIGLLSGITAYQIIKTLKKKLDET